MKKINYNPKVVKKIVLFTLLFLLVGWLTYSIVDSYVDQKHLTTKSKDIESEIPVGDYQDYLKIAIGLNPDRLREFDLANYTARLNNLMVTTTDLPTNIVIDGNDAINGQYDPLTGTMINLDTEYEVNWTNSALNGDTGVLTSENGSVSFKFNLPKQGLYYVKIKYFIPAYNGSNVERSLLVNGEIPFDDVTNLKFFRLYKDVERAEEDKIDDNGNDLKPSQKEIYLYRETYIQDGSGYVTDPYMFNFDAGDNYLTFTGVRSRMAITKVEICAIDTYDMPSYEEYYTEMVNKVGYDETSQSVSIATKYEAEDDERRFASSPTLYPISDRASAANTPTDPVKIKYNAVGGSKWSTVGDTIYWTINVEEGNAGFYCVAFRAKQDLSRGLFATRKLLVDGVQPFSEAANCRFDYDSEYSMITVGDSNGNPFYMYLEEGDHTIALQSTLGDYGQALSKVQEVIDDLNDLYLRIIIITSANPDEYVDYGLYGDNARLANDTLGRDMQTIFNDSAQTLYDVSQVITKLTGEKSSLNNTLDKLVLQIGGKIDTDGDELPDKDYKGFASNPRNVTKDLSEFKTNLSSLGTWMLDIQQQTLTVESLYVYTPDQELDNAEAGFFSKLWFDIRGFFLSFFFDYQSVGAKMLEGEEREIEVWFLTSGEAGREQANVLKNLIDLYFMEDTETYKDYKCNVILKVLAPGVLLPATLAGTGPDVAINVDGGLPVNYALRGAIYNIAEQADFEEEVLKRYTLPTSGITNVDDINVMVPYEFNDGYYAMPNTTSFLVMFYRTDIFEENGWEVPTTWEDVINLVTELQVSNLDFYLPLEGAGSQIYATILYQMGGQFYTNDHTKCDFSTEVAKKAFEQWCSYFCDYSFELSASFTNRFRSGEMPIGVASFTLYNTLAVFAADIAGKWAFAPLPGYEQENGLINNRGALGSTAAVIMQAAEDKEASWDFLKFWTSTEIQTLYSQEIESILGAGARHNTANINAMQELAWSNSELKILTSQFQNAFGVPEVPGGYYIGRNLENAIREVINNDSNARETLAEYVELIDAEITRKREEFGLPTA